MNRGRFGPPRQRRRQAAASGKEARMIPAPLSCNPRMARRRQSVRAKSAAPGGLGVAKTIAARADSIRACGLFGPFHGLFFARIAAMPAFRRQQSQNLQPSREPSP